MADELGDERSLWRGRVAWNMQLIDIRIGHDALGFDYAMSGDHRPERPVSEK